MFGSQQDPSRTEEATPKRKQKQRQEAEAAKAAAAKEYAARKGCNKIYKQMFCRKGQCLLAQTFDRFSKFWGMAHPFSKNRQLAMLGNHR